MIFDLKLEFESLSKSGGVGQVDFLFIMLKFNKAAASLLFFQVMAILNLFEEICNISNRSGLISFKDFTEFVHSVPRSL